MAEVGIQENPQRSISRRSFIKGVIAAGAAVSSSNYLFRSSHATVHAQRATPNSVERMVTLNVNGTARRVDVMKQETLAHTLRYKLGLTGTKIGCDRAECGNCTVLIDDVPHYSCSVLTHQVRGRQVTTVEGLAENGRLHPVQQAFIEEIAPQCGFCTPGQLMSAVGLLKQNPNPTPEEAAAAMSGNICRCGAYNNYLQGVLRAAEVMRRG